MYENVFQTHSMHIHKFHIFFLQLSYNFELTGTPKNTARLIYTKRLWRLPKTLFSRKKP